MDNDNYEYGEEEVYVQNWGGPDMYNRWVKTHPASEVASDTSIARLGLSWRTFRVLYGMGVQTVADYNSLTWWTVLKAKDLGAGSINEAERVIGGRPPLKSSTMATAWFWEHSRNIRIGEGRPSK